MKALLVCLALVAAHIGSAGPAVAQRDAANLITQFEDRLDEKIEQRGMNLPDGAREALLQKIVEGVRRLEEGGLEQDEIADAEVTFESFVGGVLDTIETAYPAVWHDMQAQQNGAQPGEDVVRKVIFGYCPPPVWFPWCV